LIQNFDSTLVIVIDMTRLFAISLLGAASTAFASQDAFQNKCAQFAKKIDIPNVKVNFAEYVPGGTNLSLPDNAASCATPYQAVSVDLCRVAMAVSTSNSSEISLEAWFPRDYKGRFLSTGNGGLSGCMFFLLQNPITP
jgi:feruloyl esterase